MGSSSQPASQAPAAIGGSFSQVASQLGQPGGTGYGPMAFARQMASPQMQQNAGTQLPPVGMAGTPDLQAGLSRGVVGPQPIGGQIGAPAQNVLGGLKQRFDEQQLAQRNCGLLG